MTQDGLDDKYQLGVLGTYPSTLRKGQKVRLTFGVVSETASQLMVNVLNKNDFTWVGGKVINVPAKTDKVCLPPTHPPTHPLFFLPRFSKAPHPNRLFFL